MCHLVFIAALIHHKYFICWIDLRKHFHIAYMYSTIVENLMLSYETDQDF